MVKKRIINIQGAIIIKKRPPVVKGPRKFVCIPRRDAYSLTFFVKKLDPVLKI